MANENVTALAKTDDGPEKLDGARKALVAFLSVVPKNLVSRMGGVFAGIPWPGPLQRAQIASFARTFGVNLDEVKDPLDSFRTIQDFFVRELKAGARPIDADPAAFVSPCDGAWGSSGVVEKGMILQVKGRPYSLASLLGSDDEAAKLEGGAFATLYLSPKDYHRFHAPCDGVIRRARYLPGTLWPVNKAGVLGVDGLFAENERIVATVDMGKDGGSGLLSLVPVGATVVGKVRLTFDELTTNEGKGRTERDYMAKAGGQGCPRLVKGSEWGRFLFGSTIVFAAEKGRLTLDAQPPGTPVRLGTRIGTLHT
jgi:phosphatidylserine decarboxylase